jgi:hypothetical protein
VSTGSFDGGSCGKCDAGYFEGIALKGRGAWLKSEGGVQTGCALVGVAIRLRSDRPGSVDLLDKLQNAGKLVLDVNGHNRSWRRAAYSQGSVPLSRIAWAIVADNGGRASGAGEQLRRT